MIEEFEMSNETYINCYVEVLTNTMTDAVIRNISLQANAKVSDGIIAELDKQLKQLESQKKTKEDSDSSKIRELEEIASNLRSELAKLNVMKSDFENSKSQIQHIDTFKNELIKAREEIKKIQEDNTKEISSLTANYENKIKDLNDRIEYLQLTPAKRKKIDEAKGIVEQPKEEVVEETKPEIQKPNTPSLPAVAQKVTLPEVLKDGGSF
jgi:DNA repair exonuclease SbcCD ATPase subunit